MQMKTSDQLPILNPRLLRQNHAYIGQGLTEYSLIACLVLVVCIYPFTSLGNKINSILGNMLPSPHVSQVKSFNLVTSQNTLSIPGSVPLAKTAPLSPADLKTAIQVTGVNGTTDLLADRIQLEAQQSLERHEISETDYQNIINLANQGHALAGIEKGFEEILAKAKDENEFNRLVSQAASAKNITTDEYLNQVGYSNGSTDPNLVNDPLGSTIAVGETQKFLNLYKEVKTSVLPKALADNVSQLSSQIAYLSEVSMDNILNFRANPTPISAETTGKSNQLCTIGAGSGVCNK